MYFEREKEIYLEVTMLIDCEWGGCMRRPNVRASVSSMLFNLRVHKSPERQTRERSENVEKVKGIWVKGRVER